MNSNKSITHWPFHARTTAGKGPVKRVGYFVCVTGMVLQKCQVVYANLADNSKITI